MPPLRPAPPTSQQVDKPESRKAGKHPRPVVPLPTSPPRSHPAHPLVEVIALCNHCILQSPPTPPAALPASAPLPDLTHPLPTRSPCHPAALPPARSPSYPAGKPRNRHAPLTLQLSNFPTNRQVGKPTSRKVGTHHHPPAGGAPVTRLNPPPLLHLFLRARRRSADALSFTVHHSNRRPPAAPAHLTRLNPPLLQHRFLACDRPPAPTPTTARARRLHTLQLTRCRNVVSSSHPPHPFSVLPRGKPPHLRLPPRLCYPPSRPPYRG